MDSIPTIDMVLKAATSELTKSGSESPSLDAAVLLCHTLDKPRSYLFTWPDKEVTSEVLERFQALMTRRLAGEPIAYIIGEREFWSLPLMVSPTTLIPRPDTERLVEIALTKVPETPSIILDLGTGTGAIALALASECSAHDIVGIDIRLEAKQLAEKNAQNLSITNVQFLQGSWFEPLCGGVSRNGTKIASKFALIVSNPPYIDQADPHLMTGDVRFEPASALVARENGLADIRTIATSALDYLEPNGWLLFEHGFEQGSEVRELMHSLGYESVSTEQDYAGNDRVTLGQYPSNNLV